MERWTEINKITSVKKIKIVSITISLISMLLIVASTPSVPGDIPGITYKWEYYTDAYSHLGTLAVDVDGDNIFEVFFSGPTLFGSPQALPHFWLADGCPWKGIWQLAFCKCVHSDFLFEIGVSH